MADSTPKTHNLRQKDALTRIRSRGSELLNVLLNLTDDKLKRPYEISLASDVITIASSEIQHIETDGSGGTQGSYKKAPVPGSDGYSVVAESSINTSDGVGTGDLESATPSITVTVGANEYVWMGIEKQDDGKIHLLFGAPNAVSGSATYPEFTVSEGFKAISMVLLRDDGSGSAGTTWNFLTPSMANFVMFEASGGGGGGNVAILTDIVESPTVDSTTITYSNEEYEYGSGLSFHYRNGVLLTRLLASGDSFTLESGDMDVIAAEYKEVDAGLHSNQILINPAAAVEDADEFKMIVFAGASGTAVAGLAKHWKDTAVTLADGTGAKGCTVASDSEETTVTLTNFTYTPGLFAGEIRGEIDIKVNGQEVSIVQAGYNDQFDGILAEEDAGNKVVIYQWNAGTTTKTPLPSDALIEIEREKYSITDISGLAGHVIPETDNVYDLGSSLLRWRDLYVGPGSVHIGSEGEIKYNESTKKLEFKHETADDALVIGDKDFITEGLQDFVIQDKINVPYTDIVNRAQIPNLANDLMPRLGVNRIMTQAIVKLQNEFGANGELVFSTVNDKFGCIRFVGDCYRVADDDGSRINIDGGNGYVEITFYGTGLNILAGYNDGGERGWDVSVDGGSTNQVSLTGSTVIFSRNYAANVVFNLVKNLTEGLHTVRISSFSAPTRYVAGFEILNESTTLQIPTGSAFVDRKKVVHSSLESLSYNSDFEIGVLGTKGGHVLSYLKADGTVKKAVTPTDATALYLTGADHSNEEIIRQYNWREFGCGRADDFSTLSGVGTSNRLFTLDDGTTTLASVNTTAIGDPQALAPGSNTNNFIFTFVGTGLSILRKNDVDASVPNIAVTIDGTLRGNLSNTGSIQERIEHICSGLPYGTHTVKFAASAPVTNYTGVVEFITYRPKKPSKPTGAIELSSYNIMANFNAKTGTNYIDMSGGVLSKSALREFSYNGTWIAPVLDTGGSKNGVSVRTVTLNSFVEYTFFGTGIEIPGQSDTVSNVGLEISIDGSLYTGAAVTTGDAVWTPGTSRFDVNGIGLDTLQISGLTLGVHTIKVKVVANQAEGFRFVGMEVITPIHSVKSNTNVGFQNTLPTGSQSICDERALTAIKEVTTPLKALAITEAIANGPTTTVAGRVPIPDMSTTIEVSKDGSIDVDIFVTLNKTTQAVATYLYVYVDGKYAHKDSFREYNTPVGQQYNLSGKVNIPVSKGTHHVQLFWYIGGGTLTATSTNRWMTVKEV